MNVYGLTLLLSAAMFVLLVAACSGAQAPTNDSQRNNTSATNTVNTKLPTRVPSTATPELTTRVPSTAAPLVLTQSRDAALRLFKDTSRGPSTATPLVLTQSRDAALRLVKDTSNQNKQGWTTLVDQRKRFSISVPANWNTVINEDVLELEYYQSILDAGAVTWFVTISTRSGTNIQFQALIERLLTKEPRKVDANQVISTFVQQLQQDPKVQRGPTRSEITLNGLNATRLAYRKESPNGTLLNVRNTFIYGDEPELGCGSLMLFVQHGGPAPSPTTRNTGIDSSILEQDLSIADEIVASIRILPEGAITDTCEDRTKLSLLDEYGRH